MLPSFLSCLSVVFALLSVCLLQGQGAVDSSRNSLEACEFPEVHGMFFEDEYIGSKKPPVLRAFNSTEDFTKIFPYQYIFMSCDASYPVEWIGDVPQHYYFSYILDDEVRSVSKNNRKVLNDTSRNEKFTVRLHIGNETLSKRTSMNVSAICQPAANNVFGACGKTMVFIQKYKDVSSGNKTMLRIHFEKIRLESYMDNEELIEVNDEESSCPIHNSTEVLSQLQCNSAWVGEKEFSRNIQQFQSKCVDDTDLAALLEKNQATLTPPNGILNCTANTTQGEYGYNIPYLYSLPRLCPNEDINLPYLYLSNNMSSLNETHFLSICVQNASKEGIYVGDTVTVTCISSIYYFSQGMQIQTMYQSANVTDSEQNFHDLTGLGQEQSFGPNGYRNLTSTFIVESQHADGVKCSAPVRKSKKWVIKMETFKPKVPVKVIFHNTLATVRFDKTGVPFLICNATGAPLPLLSWSRLNNEKLPANQTMAQEIGNTSSWVSSTLYFPTGQTTNLLEYYGRYICTARNKFETIEKVFLFDERTTKEEASVFGDNSLLNVRAVWFWIMIGLAILMLLVTVLWLGLKLQKQAQNLRLFTKSEIDDFLFGKPELLLDDSDMYEEMNTYAAYLPYDRYRFEIEREQLEFDEKHIIGCGAYGTVYMGKFTGDYGKVEPVAIKTVNPSSDKMYFAALLSEIKIMCYIGKHENVVGLVGACTKYLDQRQIFVATEYCSSGDMLSYILKHRNAFMNNAGFESKKDPKNWAKNSGINGYCRLSYGRLLLSPHLLLMWALQIAQGMSYLSSKKVIHGDLAARNILLSGDLKPKIADFGLSNQLQKYANYVRKGDEMVPWRWLAVESLQFMKFSVQSDVWAFGVVLYELFSLGQVPYGNHTYSELFIVSLCQGERLHRPQFASEKVYGLMLDCWKHAPENRPSFPSLENDLRILSAESEKKMLVSISNNSGPLAEMSGAKDETTTINHPVKGMSYVNHQVQEQQEMKLHDPRVTTMANITQNGYVAEVEPRLSPQVNKKYVQHPAQPHPPPHLPNSYIDWNAVSA